MAKHQNALLIAVVVATTVRRMQKENSNNDWPIQTTYVSVAMVLFNCH